MKAATQNARLRYKCGAWGKLDVVRKIGKNLKAVKDSANLHAAVEHIQVPSLSYPPAVPLV